MGVQSPSPPLALLSYEFLLKCDEMEPQSFLQNHYINAISVVPTRPL